MITRRRVSRRLLQALVALALAPLVGTPALHANQPGQARDPAALVRQPMRAIILDLAPGGTRVVAVGAHGVVASTSDAGATWTQAAAPVSTMLTCISFSDAQNGWAAGHDGVILATRDGGASWSQVEAPTTPDDSFLDVLARGDGVVIAVGAYGLCLRSDDRGATWKRLTPLEEDMHLNRISAGRSGTLYLAGESGTLAVSDDGGTSWEPLEAPYDGSFFGLHELTSKRLLAQGLRGHVYVSDDSGATWTQAVVEHSGLFATAAELPDGTIALSGAGGQVFFSRDRGQVFSASKPTGLTAVSEILVAGQTLFCAGDSGVQTLSLP